MLLDHHGFVGPALANVSVNDSKVLFTFHDPLAS